MTAVLERDQVETVINFSNEDIATRLEEVATLLEHQHANPYRVEAYRRAAQTLRRLPKPASDILRKEGLDGLIHLPTIGVSIARSIRALVTTGKLPILERLRGESDPERLLMTLPGIGKKTAEHLHDELGIESLEELELALHDERLHDVAGIGQKRLAGLRDTLATRLGWTHRPQSTGVRQEPSVAELLDVDAEYRGKAASGTLRRIAPRRFNPSGEAWLPILHTQRENRHYTALFSNTARAHEFGTTRDWVVVHSDALGERQYTIITSQFGDLKNRRIVRGREAECRGYYGLTMS